ncbi:MAG: glycoside hydrolase domain-containing protein [Acutalibacteraceae bacterium]
MSIEFKQIVGNERVFLDGKCDFTNICSGKAFKGERYSYQIAYKSGSKIMGVKANIKSKLKDFITLRLVGNVPAEFTHYADSDTSFYERTAPGLYPDVLTPMEDTFIIKPANWYSVFVTVNVPETVNSGKYDIEISFSDENGEKIGCENFILEVLDAVLPPQKLIYTQWFHCDCIANFHNTEVFSEEFWHITENYIKTAVNLGVNMLLTPIHTPPLDTKVGGERRTVQLVDISLNNGEYSFNFSNLKRWVKMCLDCGIKYFEMAHLFTQWGAKSAPKIMAAVNGRYKRLFGWETSATSNEYKKYLDAFLPELIKTLNELGIAENTYFHISDEPSEDNSTFYRAAKALAAEHLRDFKIIDALSDYSFYENGLVENPIPSLNNVHEFLEKGYKNRWTYYCCGQDEVLPNRFFCMPLTSTRAIGLPLFKYNMEGFLQWGYNFYNSQYSIKSINPYEVTDADGAFPAGDSFTVYPYKDGCIESLRGVAFYEALQDMRALEYVSEKIGREKVTELLEREFGEITFYNYPRGTKNQMKVREFINSLI